MFKKIVLSVALLSAGPFTTHAVDRGDESDPENVVVAPIHRGLPTPPGFDTPRPQSGWTFRDMLSLPGSLEHWIRKSEKHPDRYTVNALGELWVNRGAL